MSNRYSIAEARNQLARIVHDAEQGHPVEFTRRGKPVAVLVSLTEYERLSGERVGFWDAVCDFRREHDVESLNIDFPDSKQLRDKSPGRKVNL